MANILIIFKFSFIYMLFYLDIKRLNQIIFHIAVEQNAQNSYWKSRNGTNILPLKKKIPVNLQNRFTPVDMNCMFKQQIS